MSIEIIALRPEKKELKKLVNFGIDLYKGNAYYVPPLVMDEINALLPEKNPAFDFCEAQAFMAYRNGKPVGSIVAIINNSVNERTDKKDLRFGFLNFIDDAEVVDALFKAASDWGKERGMIEMIGPMGFTDLDHEGMLIEGFEEQGTMATIYNHDYYPRHMERMGFVKDIDWVEFKITIPEKLPEKYARIAEVVKKRSKVNTLKLTSKKQLKEQYGNAIFDLINEAYDGLYGYSPLTQRQIDHYISMYLGILRLDDVCLVVDSNNKLVGVGITMPSFTTALQKSRGRFLPFGWWHLLKALRGKTDTVDLMLIAVKPEYQSLGVNALLFADLTNGYIKHGYKYAETNPELEDNANVQLQWQYYENRQHRRRRAWRRPI